MSLDTHMLLAYYTNIVSPSLDIICQIGLIEFWKSASGMMMLPSVFSLIFRREVNKPFSLLPDCDFMEILTAVVADSKHDMSVNGGVYSE